MQHSYYDFFAGGGMAGFGLGSDWRCLFANDIDAKKAASYRANHAGDALLLRDVAQVTLDDLPGAADLVWASFPCQDLSLAGNGAGLAGKRSGMFRPFWQLMRDLHADGRGPRMIALENVYGAITSNGGRDFATLAAAFSGLGYRFGAVVVDAVHFLPQSRPRFFMVGVRGDLTIPDALLSTGPSTLWHPPALVEGCRLLSQAAAGRWQWWNLPTPPARTIALSDLIEDQPTGVAWHSAAETQKLLDMMTDHNRAKVSAAQATGERIVGTIYRRTRADADGVKRQRAEVRFDQIAGCLRTPAGGSSRQTIMLVQGAHVRSRLLSTREAAALMGLPADYILPARYNDAYRLAGDGVAVPVVRHLAQSLFTPVLRANRLALVA
ncbi:cytosine methyltransferase [Loktanella sp. 3ANDIMAR09]|uniref:DNA cytosine methyltransferase n=1 Tax=Loktanella sp. 3ANDIMAR09 TaxID=1225657 RepID=UPI0006FD1790|nr:DNA cytosine methyltransferase [Loktanella sp. 3ANDIMAR09]KQI69313.1 cytosine methyltransferase [Loktanella sp. 3ANDIMAR09]